MNNGGKMIRFGKSAFWPLWRGQKSERPHDEKQDSGADDQVDGRNFIKNEIDESLQFKHRPCPTSPAHPSDV